MSLSALKERIRQRQQQTAEKPDYEPKDGNLTFRAAEVKTLEQRPEISHVTTEKQLSNNRQTIEPKENITHFPHYKKGEPERSQLENNLNIVQIVHYKKEPTATRNEHLTEIVTGENWFEVRYSNGNVRYTQHSTKENLQAFYKKLSNHYRQPLPATITKIRYENNQIFYNDKGS